MYVNNRYSRLKVSLYVFYIIYDVKLFECACLYTVNVCTNLCTCVFNLYRHSCLCFLIKYKCVSAHPAGVLNHFDIFLAKLIRIKFEEALGDLRERSKLWFFIDVFLSIFIFKETLKQTQSLGHNLCENILGYYDYQSRKKVVNFFVLLNTKENILGHF